MECRGRRIRPRLTRLTRICLAGLPLLAGCATQGTSYVSRFVPASIVRAAAPEDKNAAPALPAPEQKIAGDSPQATQAILAAKYEEAVEEPVDGAHLLPISLDTVLRLAE